LEFDEIAKLTRKRDDKAGFVASMFPYKHDRRGSAAPSAENTTVKALTDNEIHADRLRSEIAQLEARYDGLSPPGVYSVLESLRQELVAFNNAV